MTKEEKQAIIIERLDANRERSWLHFSNMSLRWNELGNKRSSELSKHMFTIAALILPVSLVPVTQESFILMDNPVAKVLLIIAWACFVASLILGMRHLSKEIKFFNNWSEQESDRSRVFTNPIQTSNPSLVKGIVDKMHDESDALDQLPKVMPQHLLNLQMKTLITGVIFVGLVLVSGLFFNEPRKVNREANCFNRRPSHNMHCYQKTKVLPFSYPIISR